MVKEYLKKNDTNSIRIVDVCISTVDVCVSVFRVHH